MMKGNSKTQWVLWRTMEKMRQMQSDAMEGGKGTKAKNRRWISDIKVGWGVGGGKMYKEWN